MPSLSAVTGLPPRGLLPARLALSSSSWWHLSLGTHSCSCRGHHPRTDVPGWHPLHPFAVFHVGLGLVDGDGCPVVSCPCVPVLPRAVFHPAHLSLGSPRARSVLGSHGALLVASRACGSCCADCPLLSRVSGRSSCGKALLLLSASARPRVALRLPETFRIVC